MGFDRPFVPERMSKLENGDNVKFVHVLCDPVRRSFSHFNHMFTVQATGQGGVGEAQPGFEFLNANFGDISREEAFEKTVELAFNNMLGGRDPNDMTDDEIRDSINDYYTRWDLPPKDPKRVYPLRIPDAVLGGSSTQFTFVLIFITFLMTTCFTLTPPSCSRTQACHCVASPTLPACPR